MPKDVLHIAQYTIEQRHLAAPDTPVLLMVSGGSDSTALAHLGSELCNAGTIGPVAMLHVNHMLRGADSDGDQKFVEQLAQLLDLPLFSCQIDIGALVDTTGENMEAVARRERYQAAREALKSLCLHVGRPLESGRIMTAHTADDRVENFYMRSIVGTGPGGFRSMSYQTDAVVRPLLDLGRDDLRDYLQKRAKDDLPMVRDEAGALWREDATNGETDHFRAYVRHEMVPRAKARNPRLLETLTRSMNLIADEDDMLDAMADSLIESCVTWENNTTINASTIDTAVLLPAFGTHPLPLQRRAVFAVLSRLLGPDARVETASVEAVLTGFADGTPISGYTGNIQGDLALSANKRGLRIEPMAAYRARRKRG